MKNFKRFLSLALAVIMTLSYAPTIAWATEIELSPVFTEESIPEESVPDEDEIGEASADSVISTDFTAEGGAETQATGGYVAQIGNTFYIFLQAAISTVQPGDKTTIKLLADTNEQVVINNGQKIVLDLNGYTLSSNNYTVTIDAAELTVKDYSNTDGTISTSAATNPYSIQNLEGTLIIDSGIIGDYTNSDRINNYKGEVTINGGKILNSIDNFNGTVLINGGTFWSDPRNMSNVTVAEGHEVSSSNGFYTVSNHIAKIGERIFSTVEDAVWEALYNDTIIDKTIILLTDYDMKDNTTAVTIDKTITLDLNGHTLTTSHNNGIRVDSSGSLTVMDSSDEKTGTIRGLQYHTFYISSGTLIINGGTIETSSINGTYTIFCDKSDVIINNGSIIGNFYNSGSSSSIQINGGTFTVDPATITNATIPEYCVVKENDDGTWTVSMPEVAQIGETTYATLQAAIDAVPADAENATTITLLQDTSEKVTVFTGQKIVLDLNGHKLEMDTTDLNPNPNMNYSSLKAVSAIAVASDAELTVKDSSEGGAVICDTSDISDLPENTLFVCIENRGNLTIDGGTFSSTSYGIYINGYNEKTKLAQATINGGSVSGEIYGINNTGTLTVNGGTVSGTGENSGGIYNCATLTVNGGTFSGVKYGIYNYSVQVTSDMFCSPSKLNIMGGRIIGELYSTGYAPTYLYGGTFDADYTDDSTKIYLANGRRLVENEDDTYSVVAYDTAQIGETKYNLLKDAVDAANDGDIITLIDNPSEDITFISGKNIILDLNGYTLKLNNGSVPIQVNSGGSLTVQDSSEGRTGTISAVNNYGIALNGSGNSVTINGGTISGRTYGIYLSGSGSSVTVNGGTISGGTHGIYLLDSVSSVTVNDGIISGGDSGIYNLRGETTIYGGTVSGENAIKNFGTLTINGGTVSGTTCSITNHGYNLPAQPKIYIKGGFINGKIENEPGYENSSIVIGSISLTGGTYDREPDASFLAEGCIAVANDNSTWTVKSGAAARYDSEGNYIKAYASVSDAIAEAGTGDTIKLVADSAENGTVYINKGKEIILDLNGYTLTSKIADSHAIAVDLGAKLTVTDSSENQTGAIICESNQAGIFNSGTLEIMSGSVSNNYQDGIGINNHQGTLTINGGTVSAYSAVYNFGGNVTVTGGSVRGEYKGEPLSYSAITGIYNYGIDGADGTVTITGGTVYGAQYSIVNQNNAHTAVEGGRIEGKLWSPDSTIVLSGGTYTVNPGTMSGVTIAEGGLINANSDNTWTVIRFVAQIGENKYETFREAVNAVQNGETITLLACISEELTVSAGKNIVLDLNGHTMSSDGYTVTVSAGGTLSVKDSSESEEGTIISEGSVGILNYGTLEIISGSVSGKTYGISNQKGNNQEGTVTVNGGSVYGAVYGISNYKGTVTINEGSVSGATFGIQNTEGALIITSGSVSGTGSSSYGISNSGTVTVNGGSVSGVKYGISGWSGEITINGGTVEGTGDGAHGISNCGILTITGGTVSGATAVSNYSSDSENKAEVYIKGGRIKGELENSSFGDLGIFVLSGGTFDKDYTDSETIALEEYYETIDNGDGTWTVLKYVAQIGETKYEVLQEAIKAANNGETIILINDFTENVTISGKKIILDLNGHKLSGESYTVTLESGANLTVKDSTEDKKGTISVEGYYSYCINNKGGIFTLESGNICGEGNYANGITSQEGAEVTINGGSVSGYEYGIFNGIGCSVDINGGSVSGTTSSAKGVLNRGSLNITDGTVSGGYGIYNDSYEQDNIAETTISGGTIEGTGPYSAYGVYNSRGETTINGGTVSGYYAISNYGTLTINGGTVSGTTCSITNHGYNTTVQPKTYIKGGFINGKIENKPDYESSSVVIGFISLTGGTYNLEPDASFVAEGYGVFDNGNETWTVSKFVAQIGDTKYASVKDAVEAAQNGDTITLIADSAENGTVYINKGKEIILDLNGYTLTSEIADSHAIAVDLGAELTVTDSSENQTGAIICESNQAGIFNSGTLEIMSGSVSNNYQDGVGINNHQGTLTITGGTVSGYHGISNLGGNVTVTGGSVRGEYDGEPSDYSPITGIYNYGADGADGTVTITGGTVYGTQYSIVNQNNAHTAVEGGRIEGKLWSPDSTIVLSGGTYTVNPGTMDGVTFADGCEIVANSDGTWTVFKYVAQIGHNKYETLAEAIEAVASNGENATNMRLISDTVEQVEIKDKKNIVLDLNGYTLSSEGTTITVEGAELTVMDSSGEKTGVISATGDGYAINNTSGGTVTISGGRITGDLNNSSDGSFVLTGGTYDRDYTDSDTIIIAEGYKMVEDTDDSDNKVYSVIEVFIAQIGGVKYKTFEAALEAAKDGDTIILIDDCNNCDAHIEKKITIDLNGYTLTNKIADSPVIVVEYGAELTIRDSYKEKTGTITSSPYAGSTGIINNGGTLTIESGTVFGNEDGIRSIGGEVTINGGSVSGNTYGIFDGNGTVTITGGTVSGNAFGIGNYGGGIVTITDGSVSGHYGIFILDSKLTVSGGTVSGIYLGIHSDSEDALSEVEIKGGKIIGGLENIFSDEPGDFVLTGGTFTADPRNVDNVDIAEGYKAVENDDNTYTVISKYAAQIGENKYDTLKEAITAAKDGDAIILLKDNEEQTTFNKSGAKITLDLNGWTLNYSDDYENYAVSVTSGTELTIRDSSKNQKGSITGRRCIISSGTLTIESGSVFGGYDCICNNEGEVTIKGGTFTGYIFKSTSDSSVILYGGTYDRNLYYFTAPGYSTFDNKDGTWTVKPSTVERYNQYGSLIGTYSSVSAALDEATSGDTIKLLQDVTEENIIVPSGVTLDIAEFTLEADYIVVFDGGYLTGNTVPSDGSSYGKLVVEKEHLIFASSTAYESNGYSVLPVLNSEDDAYVFSYFSIVDVEREEDTNKLGITVNPDDSVTLKFIHQASGWINKNLLYDGTSDNAVSIMVRVEWDLAEGYTYQDFVYSDELVSKVTTGRYCYTFSMRNYSGLEGMRIYALVKTDCGLVSLGTIYNE